MYLPRKRNHWHFIIHYFCHTLVKYSCQLKSVTSVMQWYVIYNPCFPPCTGRHPRATAAERSWEQSKTGLLPRINTSTFLVPQQNRKIFKQKQILYKTGHSNGSTFSGQCVQIILSGPDKPLYNQSVSVEDEAILYPDAPSVRRGENKTSSALLDTFAFSMVDRDPTDPKRFAPSPSRPLKRK